jgi:hypothetical protein
MLSIRASRRRPDATLGDTVTFFLHEFLDRAVPLSVSWRAPGRDHGGFNWVRGLALVSAYLKRRRATATMSGCARRRGRGHHSAHGCTVDVMAMADRQTDRRPVRGFVCFRREISLHEPAAFMPCPGRCQKMASQASWWSFLPTPDEVMVSRSEPDGKGGSCIVRGGSGSTCEGRPALLAALQGCTARREPCRRSISDSETNRNRWRPPLT